MDNQNKERIKDIKITKEEFLNFANSEQEFNQLYFNKAINILNKNSLSVDEVSIYLKNNGKLYFKTKDDIDIEVEELDF
jgi:hypothetical protein